ncbi:hypothetical protein [Myroides fluvii]|uniref:hypothetical protein n=1 Tax=Myroides fluvii TaxID=2572594 RepID=UPI00131A7951|nr:hypothetical protein [Myroides fluvii]
MKKRVKTAAVFALFLSFIGVISCSSDDSSPAPTPPIEEIKVPSAIEFSDLRKSILEREKQYVNTTINEHGGITFTSKKGVEVEVNYLSVGDDSVQEGDEVTCTFIELYDKGVMALANRPTMGIYPDRDEYGYFDVTKDEYGRIHAEGYRGFIITGGEFYFDIKVKGKQVTNYGINMVVPAKNTRGFQEGMLVWQGNVNEKDDLTFTEIPIQTEMGFLQGDEANENYVMYLNGWDNLPGEIGWSNIDKYANFEGEKTQFFVSVPQGYNYETAAIYLGVKNEEGLAHLDVFLNHPELGDVFTEHYGWVPVGLEGYVFFISVDPNTKKVVYAIKDITVTKNQLIQIKPEDLKTGTTEEVIAILNGLR